MAENNEKQEVIELTRNLLVSYFCENQMEPMLSRFADDIVWMGGGEYQKAVGREEVSRCFLAGRDSMMPFDMSNDSYIYQKLSEDSCLCLSECDMVSRPGQDAYITGHQRCTFVFRRTDGQLRITHIHYSIPFGDVGRDELFAKTYAQRQYEQLQEELRVERHRNRRNSELVYLALKDTTISDFTYDIENHCAEFPEYTAKRYGLERRYQNCLDEAAETLIEADTREALKELFMGIREGGSFGVCECHLKDGKGWVRMSLSRMPDEDGLAVGLIEDITLMKANETAYMKTIQAFGEMYFAVFYCNAAENRYHSMKLVTPVSGYVPPEGDYYESLSGYAERCIANHEELQEVLATFALPYLSGHLSEENRTISADFCRTLDGKERWIRLQAIAVDFENGKLHHFVLAMQDIEEERRKADQTRLALESAFEAANRASEAKTDFLSRMSHDIRTPMNAIIGMTAIARTHLDDRERIEDCLRKITISSKHLLALINEVLDMSKIESGRVDLAEEDFELSEVVDNVLTMIRPSMDAKHHMFEVSVSGIRHEHLVGDSMRIQQVLVNILSNAVKYTPDGGRIRFFMKEQPSSSRKSACFELVFEDNGIGMSADFLPHIFDPFAREEVSSVVHKNQGTGLGMSIARNIVRMMDGDITVESKLGEGSRFTVTMYLKLQDEDEIAPEEFVNLPVLVADDDVLTCESTCAILDDLGMKSEWVTEGREAVERAVAAHERGSDYFAVILDWKMPGMDGLETTRAIRAKVGPDVPIIVFSGYDWSSIEMEAREAGVDMFIRKPLFKSRLRTMFHSIAKGTETEKKQENILDRSYRGSRILVVEDNDMNREIARELLEQMDITVEEACDGKEAVELVKQKGMGYYDLVFMDIQMPVMNGYEAAAAIRRLDCGAVGKLPIVAMTANTFAEDVRRALASGMDDHMAKPLDMRLLVRALDRWLKNS